MAIAVFDDAAWRTLYPELAGAVSTARAALLFVQAGLYLDNTDASPVADPVMRLMLLNMIVAHLATVGMTLGTDTAGNTTLTPSGIVGRVSSATEGSVSVSTETGLAPGSAGWWAQTTYGFDYYAATARYRRGFYVPAAQPSFEPFYRGVRGFAWQM